MATVVQETGPTLPKRDGDVNIYFDAVAANAATFDHQRRVIFINGIKNSPSDHALAALALSELQQCPVLGVYNQSTGFIPDLAQCLGDKNQFNGLSRSASSAVSRMARAGQLAPDAARDLLRRNPAAVALFDLLRKPEHRSTEIFAHSQGNLIVSNVLQAIAAVDGPGAVQGRVVHMFGSPSMHWPPGIQKYEYGFTWDPVSWLAGFDWSFSISKLGMPSGSLMPITHSFLEYMRHDPAFVVNRCRWGSLGLTFHMDEDRLAGMLVSFGTNLNRVRSVFEHLNRYHNSDADDVAVRYVKGAAKVTGLLDAIRRDRSLAALLVRVMDEGWTTSDERAAMALLRAP
ncbi:MAG: hypothetical protein U0794_01835 [Isosphaeraceae bacterium]